MLGLDVMDWIVGTCSTHGTEMRNIYKFWMGKLKFRDLQVGK